MKESFVHVCVFVVAVIVFLSGNDVSARRPKPPSQLTRLLAMTENRHHQSHSKRGQPVQCAADLHRCDDGSECILRLWLCDGGTPDCDDGSDERNCPTKACHPSFFKCNNTGLCLRKSVRCDGNDNCGDGSDEFNCPPVTCHPELIQCANNSRCIQPTFICDGENDCGDLSDENDCGEIPTCIAAIRTMHRTCELPFRDLFSMGRREAVNKLIETDLQEFCSPALEWFRCIEKEFEPCANIDSEAIFMISAEKHTFNAIGAALAYVCVQEINAINRHKACLLQEADDQQNSTTRDIKLAIEISFLRSCYQLTTTMNRREPFCIPDDLQACSKDVVAAQCGDEIATVVDGLANQVRTAVGCSASQNGFTTPVYNKRSDYATFERLFNSFF